ncbi:hypothetical protein NDU88_003247 [Pleurodeles waltl]|uniref:Uncharacterized protein n=1 Tax=Pleurodeles waltl TaxID=8319 RepID=A0AAV7UCT2_PLEWA|nr:hypothetical protein NDU88_003247 [Pleurodeles waltl]
MTKLSVDRVGSHVFKAQRVGVHAPDNSAALTTPSEVPAPHRHGGGVRLREVLRTGLERTATAPRRAREGIRHQRVQKKTRKTNRGLHSWQKSESKRVSECVTA